MATCVWLALGMYSYLAAVVMMPLYLLMTLARGRARTALAECVARGDDLRHLPAADGRVVCDASRAQRADCQRLQLSAGAGTSWLAAAATAAGKYLNLYWLFFDPSYLFVSGDASMINSTRGSGLFPVAFAVLLPIGLVALWRSGTFLKWVIVAGFLTAPLVSVISGAIEMNRVMFGLPFAALVATAGAIALWQARSIAPKVLAAVLVLSIGWQFSVFYRGYMGSAYRLDAATWFSGNVREALRELIARSGDGDIYVSTEIEWVHRMWRFYAIEAGRLDLIARTSYVSEPPATAKPGAKLLCPADSPRCAALTNSGAWRRVVVVPSFDGTHRYAILERTGANQSD